MSAAELPPLPKYPSLGRELATQVHRRGYELAGDGEWHEFEPFLLELAKLVPPGIAVRQVEYDRMRSARKSALVEAERGEGRVKARATGGRVVGREADSLRRQGARRLIRQVFATSPSTESPVEIKDGKIRYLRKPKSIRLDATRAEISKPILDDLAVLYEADGIPVAIARLREAAHNQGFHLRKCPKDCTLSTPVGDTN